MNSASFHGKPTLAVGGRRYGWRMLAKASSVAVLGMDALPVEVEVNLDGGLPQFQIVGLPSQAVREARKRVQAAVVNSGEQWPIKKITANLAPGDVRKEGPIFDLALAVCSVAATGERSFSKLHRYVLMGELALDGTLRPVRGALAAALSARERGAEGIVVPKPNAEEAALVAGIKVIGANNLFETLAFLSGELDLAPQASCAGDMLAPPAGGPDLADVRGQALARRALEVAAVGRHNILFVGPPGCGKTMLARRLPGILPPLSLEEALEVTHVWSVAGLLSEQNPVVTARPFRSPHHHASSAAVIGGGHPAPMPGEVSLAHRGVLFLDEVPLFNRSVLESLRQPLEEGFIRVARQGVCVKFPSSFCLVAAANPCLCGNLGHGGRACTCSSGRLDSYRSRLSGPLLDRIDLHVEVPLLSHDEMLDLEPSESSGVVRRRVVDARKFRTRRCSASPDEALIPNVSALGPAIRRCLSGALAHEPASARAVSRSLRVARTLADLSASPEVSEAHIAEALQFRRSAWTG